MRVSKYTLGERQVLFKLRLVVNQFAAGGIELGQAPVAVALGRCQHRVRPLRAGRPIRTDRQTFCQSYYCAPRVRFLRHAGDKRRQVW